MTIPFLPHPQPNTHKNLGSANTLLLKAGSVINFFLGLQGEKQPWKQPSLRSGAAVSHKQVPSNWALPAFSGIWRGSPEVSLFTLWLGPAHQTGGFRLGCPFSFRCPGSSLRTLVPKVKHLARFAEGCLRPGTRPLLQTRFLHREIPARFPRRWGGVYFKQTSLGGSQPRHGHTQKPKARQERGEWGDGPAE